MKTTSSTLLEYENWGAILKLDEHRVKHLTDPALDPEQGPRLLRVFLPSTWRATIRLALANPILEVL